MLNVNSNWFANPKFSMENLNEQLSAYREKEDIKPIKNPLGTAEFLFNSGSSNDDIDFQEWILC